MKTVTAEPGTTLCDLIVEVLRLTVKDGKPVVLTFNDTKVECRLGDTPREVLSRYVDSRQGTEEDKQRTAFWLGLDRKAQEAGL